MPRPSTSPSRFPIQRVGAAGPWFIELAPADLPGLATSAPSTAPAPTAPAPVDSRNANTGGGSGSPAVTLSCLLPILPLGVGSLLLETVRPTDAGLPPPDPQGNELRPEPLYSFLLPEPQVWHQTRRCDLADWQRLQQQVQSFVMETLPPDFPPFAGGAAGLLSYDWCRALERVPPPQRDDFQVPTLAMGVYDFVLALEHHTQRLVLIATGYPHEDLERRQTAAEERLHQWLPRLTQPAAPQPPLTARSGQPWSSHLELDRYFPLATHAGATDAGATDTGATDMGATDMGATDIAWDEVWASATPEDYRQSIDRVLGYLRAGDAFQVNVAQQLLVPLRCHPLTFYRRMRQHNAAPFAAYFELDNHRLISASPERLVRVRGDRVQTRPIKGTRRLSGDQTWDQEQGQSLQNSPKDCAENVMIVDLLRNDLSRVCRPDSLQVTRLCGLESYRHVQHLVSVVEGRLSADCTAWDLLPAVFPGGSISGAPKVRALEIINELEPVARGAYCGSLGYIGFPDANGHSNADWNILIRTATLCGDWCQIPVGGGIVLGSQPAEEYRETLDKARGLLLAAQDSTKSYA